MIEETKTVDESEDEKIARFQNDIRVDSYNTERNREKANEDFRFTNVDGGMWEDWYDDDGDRVRLEFDVITDYLQSYIGEWRNNRQDVEFKPTDDPGTSDEDAELINGIYRADYRDGSGKIAVDNAVDEVATCGFGAVKMATAFCDEEDPENDNQDIIWYPLYEAYNRLYFDRSAQRIDKKDARHLTELVPYTIDAFKKKWKDADPTSAYRPETYYNGDDGIGRKANELYVGIRYEVIKKKTKVVVYNNLGAERVETFTKDEHKLIEDELKADDNYVKVRERTILKQYVEKTVFSGSAILEPTKRIAGKWIPVIPFYGYRSYVDGVELFRGFVRKLKDPQRLYNTQISQVAENAGSNGQDIPIFHPDQMTGGVADAWADRNNKPYLLAREFKDENGQIIATGPTGYVKPSQLDGSSAAILQITPDHIRNATGGMPQDTLDPDASGKAINAIINRINLKTTTVTDNIATGLVRMGDVYQAMASDNYTTQRMKKTLGKDGKEGQQQLFKTTVDSETGKAIEGNTLQGKKFSVYADVGPQYDSLREQTVEELKGIAEYLSGNPGGQQYIPLITAVMLENVTGVGLQPLKDEVRRQMLVMGAVKPENEEEEAIVAQAQQQAEQPTEQEQAVQAMAAQAEGEARERNSKVLVNVEDAKKTAAETRQTEVDTAISISENEEALRQGQFDRLSQVFQNTEADLSNADAGLS